jgi:hypothetical protein
LELLADAKFLCRHRDGTYTRLTDGRHAGPQSGMAKPAIDGAGPRASNGGSPGPGLRNAASR